MPRRQSPVRHHSPAHPQELTASGLGCVEHSPRRNGAQEGWHAGDLSPSLGVGEAAEKVSQKSVTWENAVVKRCGEHPGNGNSICKG